MVLARHKEERIAIRPFGEIKEVIQSMVAAQACMLTAIKNGEIPDTVQDMARQAVSAGNAILNRMAQPGAESIDIVVVETRGDKVRLGVEAAKWVPVHRKEVWDAIARDKEQPKP